MAMNDTSPADHEVVSDYRTVLVALRRALTAMDSSIESMSRARRELIDRLPDRIHDDLMRETNFCGK